MDVNRFLVHAKKIPGLMRLLTLPYQIGFVRGHTYLTDQQILQVKEVLDFDDTDETIRIYEKKMVNLIGQGYGTSFAAGRMAFFTLLKALNVSDGDEVILPGFTCSVMPNAVWRTGATPIFADVNPETFGSSAKEIEKKITPRTKVVVAQHSFGIPCDIKDIIELCKKHNIFVIEDSAIALDSSVDGIKVGNWGDAAIFSTDHSKPLNTLVGGFLYTKNRSLYKRTKEISADMPHLAKAHQKSLYDRFLFERKNCTPIHYPRSVFKNYIQVAIGKLGFKHGSPTFLEGDYTKQSSSSLVYPYPAKMPPFLAQIGLFELNRWEKEKHRRKNLLKNYLDIMMQSDNGKYVPRSYFNPDLEIIPLRFAFRHPHSKRLLKKMAEFIDINWIWYREPIIGCSNGPGALGYSFGSCPTAEKACSDIINWPCVIPEGWDSKILEIFRQVME